MQMPCLRAIGLAISEPSPPHLHLAVVLLGLHGGGPACAPEDVGRERLGAEDQRVGAHGTEIALPPAGACVRPVAAIGPKAQADAEVGQACREGRIADVSVLR